MTVGLVEVVCSVELFLVVYSNLIMHFLFYLMGDYIHTKDPALFPFSAILTPQIIDNPTVFFGTILSVLCVEMERTNLEQFVQRSKFTLH